MTVSAAHDRKGARQRVLGAVLAGVSAIGMTVTTTGIADAQPTPESIGPESSDAAAAACVQRALDVDTAGAPYGFYGTVTTSAVRNFQATNGLPATGRVGPATGALLAEQAPADCKGRFPSPPAIASSASAPPVQDRSYRDCPLLLEGQTHPCVARLPNDLNVVNADYDLPGTNVFGPATRTAVLDFQGRNDLPADGNVGAGTADLLEKQAATARAGQEPEQVEPGTEQIPTVPANRDVVSPDIKLVRYLQVGASECTQRLLSGLQAARPEKVAPACALLDFSSNPTPPSSLAGDNWRGFVASEEFRGFSHIPPMRLTCRGGRVASVERHTEDIPFGVSPGWTFMNRTGKRIAEKAEWYEGDVRFRPDEEEVRYLADGSGALVTARQASRIAAAARGAQFGMLGYDAPFIWSAAHVVLLCDGAVKVIYGGSSIPGTKLYAADQATSSIPQSDDLARFVRAGGRVPQPPGKGDLYDDCKVRQINIVTGAAESTSLSCELLQEDGGMRTLSAR